MIRTTVTTLLVCALAVTSQPARAGQPSRVARADPTPVDFNRQIRPLLAEHCFKCHGPGSTGRQADLRLDKKQSVFAPLVSGGYALVKGDSDSSELYLRISSEDDTQRMPPPETGKPLTAAQIALVKRWIDEGARWETHWAYEPPRRVPPPKVKHADWPIAPFDYFTLARMEAEGLSPSPPEERERWLRRITFDLTGYPPTLEEIDAFLADRSPRAYERVADRLLRSPRFGERMAAHWLDLARYADTHGLHIDGHRDMWRWRDWVIEAFNDNKPFDVFTIEQLAGDLLPHPTLEQRIATGFNRNAMINYEAGAIPEEYLNEYVADRVVTTSTVWLGQTMLCARCHDHKYDPFTQRDFYRLYSIFNGVAEKGLDGVSGNAVPFIKAPTRAQRQQIDELARRVAALETTVAKRAAKLEPGQAEWERGVAAGTASLGRPPDDMLLHLPLDEAEGDKARDTAAKDRHAAIVGEAIRVDGKFGRGLLLGGGTHLELAGVADFASSDAFTASAWVFSTTEDEMSVLARIDDKDGAYRGWELYLAKGRAALRLVNHWEESALEVRAKEPVATYKWHHLLAVHDGSGKAAGVALFIDGAAVEVEVTHDRLASTIHCEQPLRIGARDKNADVPLKGMLDDVRIFKRRLGEAEVARLYGNDPIRALALIPAAERTEQQAKSLRALYLEQDAEYRRLDAELETARKRQREFDAAIPTTMVMEELETPRETFILARGDYRHPTVKVSPGTPACLPPMPADAPRNRLGLARWLVDPGNPLTARVTVNHFWQMIFGTGIVATSEDFGTRGDPPSHPELLDWLAVDFVESSWDVKRLLRMMVLSATYRQSGRGARELLMRDPGNRLLARGPRLRLTAEMVRDSALMTSGLLRERIGGRSVFPYQPPGLWRDISFDQELYTAQVYTPSEGDDVYRRGMYTFWKRASPPPMLQIFDAPERLACTARRTTTSTPFQALVLMNDETFVEAARFLAERMMREGGDRPDERIAFAFRLLTSRRPSEEETAVLRRVFEKQLAHYRSHPDAARQLLTAGNKSRDCSLDVAELASWSVVASTIYNFSEASWK